MKIAVIGCGMGGMASAIQLARDGHRVTVFEAFSEARPLGAGLLLQPTGLTALAQLGLCGQIVSRGAVIEALEGRRPDNRLIMDLRYAYGRRGEIGVGIHRATLFDALLATLRAEGVELRTGHAIRGFGDFHAPVLQCDQGEIGSFDAVIVADGAHSTLRQLICPHARTPVYPWGAVWTIRPDTDGSWHADRVLAQIYSGTGIMAGILPVGENRTNSDGPPGVSFFWSLRLGAIEKWREAGLDAFRAEISACWPEATRLLDGVKSLDAFATATYRDVRCPRWFAGKVIMIGDAAHGASPQLGQGANMAICDGLAIASELKAAAPSRAFLSYEARRRPTLHYYTWMSWALTPVFQGGPAWLGKLRDLFCGLACRLPGFRNLMTWTLVGRGRWLW
ncbi:FAD-dependent oxidoreductase [Hyphobacterium sp.]|uniref:FAD-dependent oxidoreductase n=1 Tax=Hyphobacterium sp. TaxID=2004662 RepID=UPI003B5294DB